MFGKDLPQSLSSIIQVGCRFVKQADEGLFVVDCDFSFVIFGLLVPTVSPGVVTSNSF